MSRLRSLGRRGHDRRIEIGYGGNCRDELDIVGSTRIWSTRSSIGVILSPGNLLVVLFRRSRLEKDRSKMKQFHV
jgi:hypothetical protein